jgi:hypothetical protein
VTFHLVATSFRPHVVPEFTIFNAPVEVLTQARITPDLSVGRMIVAAVTDAVAPMAVVKDTAAMAMFRRRRNRLSVLKIVPPVSVIKQAYLQARARMRSAEELGCRPKA